MFGLDMIYYQLILVGVFAVATIVGYLLIKNVPSLLHTPLMSGMNALSGITVLGALTATAATFVIEAVGLGGQIVGSIFGIIAIALAMINVVGGFAVTDRMLAMIVKKKAKHQEIIYISVAAASAGLIAVMGCFNLFAEYAEYGYLALSIALSCGVLGGIAMMGNVKYAKIGNRVSAVCMLLSILVTILYTGHYTVYTAYPIYVGLILGSVVGIIIAKKVSMIQMPQMVALLNGLGGAASALVGLFAMFGIGAALDNSAAGYFNKVTSSIALVVGMLTLTGSLVAAGKLHRVKFLPQKPVVWKHHPLIQMGSVLLIVAAMVVYIVLGGPLTSASNIAIVASMFVILAVASAFFGFAFAIRVGGADMPITISLLNSLSGVAGAIAGLAIGDLLLVTIGGIVGASGLLLTQIMCKAMNRSLMAILTGKAKKDTKAAPKAVPVVAPKQDVKVEEKQAPKQETKKVVEENPAVALKNAKNVIIVPGYGMAIAQAQHAVKQLADKLVANGTTVKYAVHPVAGRMPGHMNVLLCEANVEYEDLYEMDNINPEFATADATIVVGANDVLNPAATYAEGTPIYGMPVLSVNDCKNIFIFNYDLKPGYAGVENPIYTRENGVHLYLGNAAETVKQFINEMDGTPVSKKEETTVATTTESNPAAALKNAKNVIIVPGYGMAIAQAQHTVKHLADKLVANGTTVKYAVHPVAGRMPGHMNVLLCEADVDYEDLYEMDNINPEFATADATIVVGANDVLNPAATYAEGTPIYGMPVLSVNDCKNIYIFNYDLKPGYAGVENPIYTRENGVHLYLGNAAETVQKFIDDIDKPAVIEAKAAPKQAEKKVDENPAAALKNAKNVIIVPGYGMAIAQAQHTVKHLADKLVANGTTVKYAVHPVAGRMPGHMNVLLCEADVDYEDLYEMDNINPEFATADATIVVGANDVLNPAATYAEGTPIYGMPVLSVNDCKNIYIFNYDLKPGYAGVENPIYTRENGVHLYLGNAAETVQKFIDDIDK